MSLYSGHDAIRDSYEIGFIEWVLGIERVSKREGYRSDSSLVWLSFYDATEQDRRICAEIDHECEIYLGDLEWEMTVRLSAKNS